MAEFWNILRNEVRGTMDEFREKGVVGAFRDAALDAGDIIKGAGETVYNGVQTFIDGGEGEAVLRVEGVPTRGSFAPLEFPDGMIAEATVVDIDGVSNPPRARVTIEGVEEPFLVDILPPGVERAEAASSSTAQSLFQNLRQEWDQTVQDFREKGAVGAMKDAALDAVDMVGNTANYAVTGAKSLIWDEQEQQQARNTLRPKETTQDSQEKSAAGAAKEPAQAASPSSGEMPAVLAAASSTAESLLENLRQEVNQTVQDFREKGAVGAMKDAALDAVDMVGNTANYAVTGARSLIWDGQEEQQETVQDSQEKGAVGVVKEAAAKPATPVAAPAAPHPKEPSQASPSRPSSSQMPTASGPPKPATPVVVPARMQPKEPSQASPSSSEMPAASAKPKSLVSMRRNMFEKPKASETKKEAEEVID